MKKFYFRNSENDVFRYLLFCLAVVGIVLICIYHASCQITTEGIKVLEAAESPEIKSAKVLDEKSFQVQFSTKVNVASATVSKLESGEQASLDKKGTDSFSANGVLSEDGTTVVYNFVQSTVIGQRYQLFSEIKDSRGNSLTFALPFEGFNNRVPILIISELTGGYDNKNLKCQYIMLRALTDGNLGGLGLFSARYSLLSEFQFPAAEVKAGEYIMIHLQSYEGEPCTNELGADLTQDKGKWSKADIRDLYYATSKYCLHKEQDVIILRNKVNMEILDAVLYKLKSKPEENQKFTENASLVLGKNKWKSNSVDSEPVLLGGSLNYSGRCLKRNNCDKLFNLAKQNKLSQEYIISSQADWEESPTYYKLF